METTDSRLIVTLRRYWWKYAVLLAFAVLVAIAITKHEPFVDEGQAWLVARDASPLAMLFKYLSYEGHPFLWYFILMIPAKLGAPYLTLSVISGVIAIISVFLWLRYSPFPAYITAAFPFTFWIVYQYSVVARSYTLVLSLLILIALVYPTKIERVWLFTLLVSLLANVSLHCTLIAIAIFMVHALDLRKKWFALSRSAKRKNLEAFGVFAAVLAFVTVQLWPRPDSTTRIHPDFSVAQFWRVARFLFSGPMTNYWWLTLIVLLGSLAWFWRRKVLLLYLLPALFLFVFISAFPTSTPNNGILVLVWLFVMWISFQGLVDKPIVDRLTAGLHVTAICMLVIVVAVQIVWGARAFVYDLKNPYSGTQAVADLIKANDLEKAKIFMVGHTSTGVLPYFKTNIYSNYNGGKKPSFWYSSTSNKTPDSFDARAATEIEKNRPDLVVADLASFNSQEQLRSFAERSGYAVLGPFPGNEYFESRAGTVLAYSYVVLVNRQKFRP